MSRFNITVLWALIAAVTAHSQHSLELVQILPMPSHPIVFRSQVFIEKSKNQPDSRQNRANWYSRGVYTIHCKANTPQIRANMLILKALRPFSQFTSRIVPGEGLPTEIGGNIEIMFDSVENVFAVENALHEIGIGTAFFVDDWTAPTGVPDDGVFSPRKSTSYLYATGTDDPYSHHNFNTRTRGWALFSMKLPMAWDISMGSSSVVLGFIDSFKSCSPSPTTTDVVERTSPEGTGNVRRIVSTTTSVYTGLPANVGNGVDKSTYPIKTGHGYAVLGSALSKSDNDPHAQPSEGPSGSAVGTCPECNGVLFPLNPPGAAFLGDPCLTPAPNAIDGTVDASLSYDIDKVDDFDLDMKNDANGAMKRLDILNCSYVGGNGVLHRLLLRNGVAVIAAAGNDWGMAPFDPAATVIIDDIPSKDTKVLAVGSIEDGVLLGSDCNPWALPQVMSPVWKGSERFARGYVYSPGLNKFSLDTATTREQEKRNAYIDVVAPGGNIWTLHQTTGTGADPRGYAFQGGTSLATALVSGVAGLMFSINPDMGVDMNDITDLPAVNADGLDVQRRLYNIITFTADKTVDLDGRFQYVMQGNDQLRRTWTQRMGFGKVNAYRAVAHCIQHKGQYEYLTSTTLAFSNNVKSPSGIRLMHWGSRIKDGLDWPLTAMRGGSAADDGVVDVIAHGGRSLPSEAHNNQGVTRLSSNTTVIEITVPDSSTLCIDGMLLSEGSAIQHVVRATEPHAMLMAEGLLRNVELAGRLRIGDLVMDGPDALPTLRFTRDGEVYGSLKMTQRATFIVESESGSCRTRPGSHIRMSGTKGIVVQDGAEFTIDHASRITRSAAQEIDVRNGATMRVLAGSKVHIGARVRVRSGSTLVIEDSSVVFLFDLIVEPGGTCRIMQGAHVAFGDSVIDCNGIMEIDGGSTQATRIVLTTAISDNCIFDVRNHSSMNSLTVIRAAGSLSDWRQSNFLLHNTDLKNVRVSLINIDKAPVDNCAFSLHSNLPSRFTSPASYASPYMLQMDITVRPSDAPDSYYCTAVMNTTFKDSAGAIPIAFYAAPNGMSMNRYYTCGIRIQNHVRSDITNCDFENLHECIATRAVTYSTINFCNFTDADYGANVQDGQPRLCNNSFLRSEYPASLYNAERAYHNDNTMASSRVAIRIVQSAMQAFRNNDLSDYWKGISVTGSVASLTSLREDIAPYELEMYGRNRFDVADPQPYFQTPFNHPNPFMRRQDLALYAADVAQLTDLYADAYGGMFLVKCGQNRFGANTTSHVSYEDPSQLVIDFSVNNCQPYANVRYINVGATGAPLNIEGVTDNMCGPLLEQDNCSNETWRDGRNEIPGAEHLKRRLGNEQIQLRVSSTTMCLAIPIELASDAQQILRLALQGTLPTDVLEVKGLHGASTFYATGTYAVLVYRSGAVVQRALLLITP